MSPAEYLKIRAKFQAEFDEKLNALNLIWAAQNNDTPPPKLINGHDHAADGAGGLWREIARHVITQMPPGRKFTIREIEEGIAERDPRISTSRASISIFLRGLADSKEIDIEKPGAGRKATTYKAKRA